jgi:hypothetical protein
MADPISMLLLSTLIGGGAGLGKWLLDKIPGLGPGAENVNTDYANNPIYKMLFGEGGGYADAQGGMDTQMGGMESSLANMQSFLANAVSSSKAYDPNAFWKDFMAAQPDMQALISGPTGSFKAASEANLSDFVKQATSETASELSGMGALYSGALGDISGQKIGKEAGKSNTELAQLQASLMSQLWGSAIPQFSGNRQFQTQNLVNTYMGGAQTSLGAANTYQGAADMYSQQLMQMLGIGADLSSPLYVQTPGLGDSIMQGLGLGSSFGSALGMIPGQKASSPTTRSADDLYNALGRWR